MMSNIFQQALVTVKSEVVVGVRKFSLPTPLQHKGYDTPYLRRRMHDHKI